MWRNGLKHEKCFSQCSILLFLLHTQIFYFPTFFLCYRKYWSAWIQKAWINITWTKTTGWSHISAVSCVLKEAGLEHLGLLKTTNLLTALLLKTLKVFLLHDILWWAEDTLLTQETLAEPLWLVSAPHSGVWPGLWLLRLVHWGPHRVKLWLSFKKGSINHFIKVAVEKPPMPR